MEATILRRPLLVEPLDLEALGGSLNGRLILPGDDEYEAARQVHQAAVDVRPLAIVRAADARDVSNTICFARDNELELAVRGGGHSLAGHGTVDGGIVLDLADMRGLHIDPDARVAWAQPGLTAIEFTEAAAAHGLATPFGDTGSVGIAGLTLGGGVGWLVRKHGLTIDALIAVEIVTADGRQLIASETEHPDLFWAVRGGGGNFGVVTRFQYRLYPVGMILGGAVLLPPTADVLRGLVPVAAAAPRELSTITFVLNAAPPLPFLASRAPLQAGGHRDVRLRRRSRSRPGGARAVPPARDPARRARRADAVPRHLPVHRRGFEARRGDDALERSSTRSTTRRSTPSCARWPRRRATAWTSPRSASSAARWPTSRPMPPRSPTAARP